VNELGAAFLRWEAKNTAPKKMRGEQFGACCENAGDLMGASLPGAG